MNTDNVTATTATEAGLTAAFEAFNAHSLELNAAYDRLQSQVATLATALRRARNSRNRETAARERLAERMAQILEALPALVL
ncbi:MAG: PAS domain-containing sensor histidine kinase, partial [Pseudomonadota bacterium]